MRKVFAGILAVVVIVFFANMCFAAESFESGNERDFSLRSILETLGIIGKEPWEIAHDKAEELLQAMENRDKEKVYSLFAPGVISETVDFDAKIEELFDYYQGKSTVMEDNGESAAGVFREEKKYWEVKRSYDIQTSEQNYRLAIKYTHPVSKDYNLDYAGIESLYIIRAEEDIDLRFTYWGRDGMLSGIHIGIPSDIIDEPWYPEMVESIRNQN